MINLHDNQGRTMANVPVHLDHELHRYVMSNYVFVHETIRVINTFMSSSDGPVLIVQTPPGNIS